MTVILEDIGSEVTYAQVLLGKCTWHVIAHQPVKKIKTQIITLKQTELYRATQVCRLSNLCNQINNFFFYSIPFIYKYYKEVQFVSLDVKGNLRNK